MKKIIIAIDGFSSTGKSTIAKQLAATLEYIYVDTGAMYRAVTLYALRKEYINAEDFSVNDLVENLDNIQLNFIFNEAQGFAEMYLNGENVEQEIRTLKVSDFVSKVAAVPEVRYQLVKQQQKMGENKGIVMDGRDIGTVVFPNAELKLFMTASPEKRAMRRYKELIDKGEDVKYEDVLRNVQNRDYIDSHREDSPLRQAEEAIAIDNSDMGLKEQFERILNLVNRTINA
ncbi:(d)CMP kinase [Kordia sp.]|uniref:(d)CMP kinase n=1 Tax=Kordia sp. TaxID=1965332 RepID=UPI0025BAD385|nr:(d)CMP kinase [Kordia sp.]MCH2194291.1 (d)CMP kinase [Kordia sp.]